MPTLKTLEEYEASDAIADAPELSGVACPECSEEMAWDSPSLVLKEPPMRRINCPSCSFSRVVAYKG